MIPCGISFQEVFAEEKNIGPSLAKRRQRKVKPRPDALVLDDEQLTWLEDEFKHCDAKGHKAVLFLHCYASDLKQGGRELAKLLRQYPVLLVDMGHTHYSEISNDGDILYTATRSTGQIEEGQIEEGQVGYSVTTIDENVVSWHFVELGSPSLISITTPADERLITSRTASDEDALFRMIRAKIWSPNPIQNAIVQIAGNRAALGRDAGELWSCVIDIAECEEGSHLLEIIATDSSSMTFSSSIRFRTGQLNAVGQADTEQEKRNR